MWRLTLVLALSAGAAAADVAEAVSDAILPGLDAFAAATADLAAVDDCTSPGLRPAYQDAFDAWMGVSHLRMGPLEEEGRALAIAFWPDPKGLGRKALAEVLRTRQAADLTPDVVAEQSVAMRGLFGLERLLYPPAALPDAECALALAIAEDLARLAAETRAGWQNGLADALVAPGPGKRYLTLPESRQALLTALVTGLDFTADQRLGRPLGSFDRPTPERAEAIAAGRPLRNVGLSLRALRDLALALSPDSPQTSAAFGRAIARADALDDPLLAGVADPAARLKVEILQQAVRAARDAVLAEIAPALGVDLGFNAQDGD